MRVPHVLLPQLAHAVVVDPAQPARRGSLHGLRKFQDLALPERRPAVRHEKARVSLGLADFRGNVDPLQKLGLKHGAHLILGAPRKVRPAAVGAAGIDAIQVPVPDLHRYDHIGRAPVCVRLRREDLSEALPRRVPVLADYKRHAHRCVAAALAAGVRGHRRREETPERHHVLLCPILVGVVVAVAEACTSVDAIRPIVLSVVDA